MLFTASGRKKRNEVDTFFWIPGGRDLSQFFDIIPLIDIPIPSLSEPLARSGRQQYADVRSTHLLQQHSGARGPDKNAPTSSIGILDNGEHFFIYRFILFWDGFQMYAGRQASGEGIYMLCLNIPPKQRKTPDAVRVLSLTPPGVKSAVVLSHILSDIIQGMTVGFLDVDADGVRRRIFLDLVGVVGDTPALNSTLDVLGHTAAACCHLCRYVRGSSSLIGSRYANAGYHGFHSAFSRSFFQQTAVQDCAAASDTCRLLGVKKGKTSADLVLHKLRAALHTSRSNIPTTCGGNIFFRIISTPIVPVLSLLTMS